jgi:hypothetical protein
MKIKSELVRCHFIYHFVIIAVGSYFMPFTMYFFYYVWFIPSYITNNKTS